jgi:hypothetical protein
MYSVSGLSLVTAAKRASSWDAAILTSIVMTAFAIAASFNSQKHMDD